MTPGRILRAAASPRITVACLAWLFALTIAGTLHQASHGLYAARRLFFDSWFFPAGFIPVPGTQACLAVFFANLLASMAVRFRVRAGWGGLWLIHAGLVVLLVGGLITRLTSIEAGIRLEEGQAAGAAVSERHWELAAWRGGNSIRRVVAYDTDRLEPGAALDFGELGFVAVVEQRGAADRGAEVSAVRLRTRSRDGSAGIVTLGRGGPPARVFDSDGALTLSLRPRRYALPAVLRLLDFEKQFHPGSSIPRRYSSRVSVETGPMTREAVISMNRPLRYKGWTFYQVSYSALPDGRETSTLAAAFNRGRWFPYVATVMTFAGLILQFASKLVRRRGAVLLLLLIGAAGTSAAADSAPAGIPLESFARLPVLEGGRVMPLDTFARQRLLQLSGRSSLEGGPAIAWLARAFFAPAESAREPVFLVTNPETAEALALSVRKPRQRYSYDDLRPRRDRLAALADRAMRAGGGQSAAESELIRLAFAVRAYESLLGGVDVPLAPAPGHEPWGTPRSDPGVAAILDQMAAACRSGRAAAFDDAAAELLRTARARAPSATGPLDWEVRFNRIDPFYRAALFYAAAVLAALSWLVGPSHRLRAAALVPALAGLALHTAGLVLRALIMQRPPVTNLYSTFVFVAWCCVVLGLLVEVWQRNTLGLLSAGLGGFTLLLVSNRFALSGDTMQKVAAVLDSNLWLTAHVLTIMIGFAACLMAGVAGHAYLLAAWRHPADADRLASIHRVTMGLLGIGLTFTFLGTMLGGVWADQAWGRFWGWDPKENGALLVILWCSLLYHARPAGWIAGRGMAAGCIALNIVVALAWLGVNLLGVGLHSYGFTSGLAGGLGVFVAAESALAAAGLWLTRRPAG